MLKTDLIPIMILSILLVYAGILHFWQLDNIPPLISSSQLGLRYVSAFLSLGSILVFYFFVNNSFKNKKLALISSWILTILPWSLEQGRIVSQPNNFLFFFLIILLIAQMVKNTFQKLLIYSIIPIGLFFFYPQFWLFRGGINIFQKTDYFNNLFFLLSPSFLFFKNITFWWGGVREFGVMYASLLPIFIVGIYQTLVLKYYSVLLWTGIILFISSASPFLPESREFFLIIPFLSVILGLGINSFRKKWLTLLFISLLILYEITQFFHYYTVHYPQQIKSAVENIHETF